MPSHKPQLRIQPRRPPVVHESAGPKSILVLDDEPSIAKLLFEILTKCLGYETEIAGTGEEAIGKMSNQPSMVFYRGKIPSHSSQHDDKPGGVAVGTLPDSGDIFRQILEHLPCVIWMVDPGTKQVIYVNPAFEKIGGRSADDGYRSPLSWLKAIHPEDRQRISNAALTKAWCGEFNEEFRIIRPDGSIRWIHGRSFPILNKSGVVDRIIGTAWDITEKKQLELRIRDNEGRFSNLIEITADAVIMMNESHRITHFNKRAEQIFGYQAAEMIGQPLDRLIPARLIEAHREHLHAFGAGTERARLMGERGREISGCRKDGTIFPADVSISKSDWNEHTLYTAILRDVTDRKRDEKALQIKTDQLQSITDTLTAFLQNGNWQEASATLLRNALSQTESEYGFIGIVAEGPVLRILAHEGINWDATVNREFYDNAMKTYREKGYLEFTHFDNLFGKVITTGQVVIANDAAADPRAGGLPPGHPPLRHFLGVPIFKGTEAVGMIGVANRRGGYSGDEQKAIEILAQTAAVLYDSYRRMQYDPLTSLPNRTLFRHQLQQAIFQSQDKSRPLAVMLMDLDRFKEVNDTLGHHRGDLILQQVSTRLKNLLRPTDMIARLGGDEFGILLSLRTIDDSVLVARKIQAAMEKDFEIEGLPIAIEISVGIAIAPDHGENPESLIQRADVAMYIAKKEGTGFALYNPAHDQHSPRRLALMGEMRRALDENQLFLVYQPKIDLRSGRVVGVEALVRWKHPGLGIVPPGDFIEPVEQTALIKPLTSFVIREALHQCKVWHQSGINLDIAVNLSARNLHDPQFLNQLDKVLKIFRTKQKPLELELTESAIMIDSERALGAINRLKALGVRFSIDDFGTGHSSLAYLKKLPADTLKIDKSFILNMLEIENDAVIVRSTIDMGHNLGLNVVAEGVENKETYNRLVEWGCDLAQGYYMCRPLPADEFTRWLRESPFIPPPLK